MVKIGHLETSTLPLPSPPTHSHPPGESVTRKRILFLGPLIAGEVTGLDFTVFRCWTPVWQQVSPAGAHGVPFSFLSSLKWSLPLPRLPHHLQRWPWIFNTPVNFFKKPRLVASPRAEELPNSIISGWDGTSPRAASWGLPKHRRERKKKES